MKVILTKDVAGLGRSGDVKEVSDGHARNFLLPRRLALPATTQALQKLQKETEEHQVKVAKDHERALTLRNKLEGKTFAIKARAQGKNLFAALREKDLAQVVMEKSGVEISPEMIIVSKPLKSIGLHSLEIRLAKDIKALVSLNVEAA